MASISKGDGRRDGEPSTRRVANEDHSRRVVAFGDQAQKNRQSEWVEEKNDGCGVWDILMDFIDCIFGKVSLSLSLLLDKPCPKGIEQLVRGDLPLSKSFTSLVLL